MQTRFDLQNTCCDDFILWVTCLAHYIVCILKCFIDVPDELEMLVDLLVNTVNACMLAQQQYELNYQKKQGYQGIKDNLCGVLNPKQATMAQQAKVGMATVIGGAAGGGIAAGQVQAQ